MSRSARPRCGWAYGRERLGARYCLLAGHGSALCRPGRQGSYRLESAARDGQPIRQGYYRKRRSRSALATTETLDSAIAAPAISGLRKPAAASGSAATL